jgi:hypothetical protein
MGTSTQDVTSVVIGGSALVSHVAKVLSAVHASLNQLPLGGGGHSTCSAAKHNLDAQLSPLIAMLQAEVQKSERSLQGCISSLPSFAAACLETRQPHELLQAALQNMPRLQDLTEQLDVMLTSAMQLDS